MKKCLLILTALVTLLGLSGCMRYIEPYNSSPDVVASLGQYSEHKIRVVDFDSPLGEGILGTCRGYALIGYKVDGGLVRYIQDAFVTELELAGLYAPESKLMIKGTVNQIALETLHSGKWTLKMTLVSSNGRSVSVSEVFRFKSNLAGETACQTATNVYPMAVQNLIRKAVTDPAFKLLFGPSSYPKAPMPEPPKVRKPTQPDKNQSGFSRKAAQFFDSFAPETKEEDWKDPEPTQFYQVEPIPAHLREKLKREIEEAKRERERIAKEAEEAEWQAEQAERDAEAAREKAKQKAREAEKAAQKTRQTEKALQPAQTQPIQDQPVMEIVPEKLRATPPETTQW